MNSYIKSTKVFKNFDSKKDLRRDIYLVGKIITDISMIPTDVEWDNIYIEKTLVKSIPSGLSCNKLVIDDNPFITSIETTAKEVVVSKCYCLKKIVAPNCISLSIHCCPSIKTIPINDYRLLEIKGNRNAQINVPNINSISAKYIRFENAIISSNVSVAVNAYIENCTFTKKNVSISAGDNIYLYNSSVNNATLSCESITIGECLIGNISKKSSFKNFECTINRKKCDFSYDFLIGRTLDICKIIESRKDIHFPENLSIRCSITSIGMIPPKRITIEEFTNITLDSYWDNIYNTKNIKAYGHMNISAACAKNVKDIISIGEVKITNSDDTVLDVSLDTLICTALHVDDKIKLSIPENHIIGSLIAYNDTFDTNPKKIYWYGCDIYSFRYDDEYDVTLTNFPIPNIKGFTIYDGILSFYTHKKNIGRRTCYVCSMSHCYNKYVIKDTLPSNKKIFAHGLTFKNTISSIERKKDSYFRNATEIKSQYTKIPKDMPLEKDFCIKMYRDLTGGCSGGVSMFLSRFKELNKTYTINDIVDMTKGEYGHQRFVDAFK
jgi:hypothetical protein